MSKFTVEGVICGYHVHKSIWLNPIMEKELSCEREIGNAQDSHVVLKVLQYRHFAHTSRKVHAPYNDTLLHMQYKLAKKTWQILPKFFPLQSFLLYGT